MSVFHWNNGWHFERLANGDVEMTKRLPVVETVWTTASDTYPSSRVSAQRGHRSDPYPEVAGDLLIPQSPHVVLKRFTIPADEWVSVVAAMAAGGGSPQNLAAVTALHEPSKS